MVAPAVLAFLLATAVTFADFVTTNFPGTLCLAARCRSLWAYSALYGAFGIAAFLLYPQLWPHPEASASSLSMDNAWFRAAVVGVTIKSVMHFKIASLPTPGATAQPIPIGIATFLQPFEPLMIKQIGFEYWQRTTALLTPAAAKYPDLQATKIRATAAIPGNLDGAERLALANDLGLKTTVNEVLATFLSAVGCEIFKVTFP
jgi:hypothetical protein